MGRLSWGCQVLGEGIFARGPGEGPRAKESRGSMTAQGADFLDAAEPEGILGFGIVMSTGTTVP